MLNILRLEIKSFFKGGTIFFILFLPLFILLMLTTIAPIDLLSFTAIGININIISFFIFGSFFNNIRDKKIFLQMQLLTNRIIIISSLIVFTLFISTFTSIIIISSIFLLQLLEQVTGLPIVAFNGSIEWNFVWWNTIFFFILAGTVVSCLFALVIALLTKSKNYFYSIGVLMMFILIFSGGMFVSEQVIAYDNTQNVYFYKPNSVVVKNWMFYFRRVLPQFYLNQISILSFRIKDSMDYLNPLASINLMETLQTLIYPIVFSVVALSFSLFLMKR